MRICPTRNRLGSRETFISKSYLYVTFIFFFAYQNLPVSILLCHLSTNFEASSHDVKHVVYGNTQDHAKVGTETAIRVKELARQWLNLIITHFHIVKTEHIVTIIHILFQVPFLGEVNCSARFPNKRLTRYSNTNVNDLSVCIISCKVTMLLCFKSRNNETRRYTIRYCISRSNQLPSRMAVNGTPSSCSSRISLRATKLFVRRLFPLNTVAYAP